MVSSPKLSTIGGLLILLIIASDETYPTSERLASALPRPELAPDSKNGNFMSQKWDPVCGFSPKLKIRLQGNCPSGPMARAMLNRRINMESISFRTESKLSMEHWYAYRGYLGEVICNGQYFFAWKDGCLVGTSKKLEEVMKALACKEMLKTSESRQSVPNSFII